MKSTKNVPRSEEHAVGHCTYEDAQGLQRSGKIINDAGSSAMILIVDDETGKTVQIPHYKVRIAR